MLLEQQLKEVSNRYSLKVDSLKVDKIFFYSSKTEIKEKVRSVSEQEEPSSPEKIETGTIKTDQDNFQDKFGLPFEEYFLLNQQNLSPDYQNPFLYEENKKPLNGEEVYSQEDKEEVKEEDKVPDAINDRKAEKLIHEILKAAVLGNKENISFQDIEYLNVWISLNRDKLPLFEQSAPFRTMDINYGRI